MVFATTLIGQNASAGVSETPFPGGNITTATLEATMIEMANSTETGTNATTGGNLTINSVDYTQYDYNILPGETISGGYTTAKYWTPSHDRAALLAFKGDLTINTTFQPNYRKIFTCIYVKGNLNINASVNMNAARGGNQHNKGFGQTNPGTAMPVTGSYSLATNAAGGGGNPGSAGGALRTPGGRGMFSGGGGGHRSGNGQYGGYNAQSYGGQGAGGGWGGGVFGGGAGNGGGQRGNPGSCSAGSVGGNGVGGTLIIFVEGTVSTSGGTLSAIGGAGGYANGNGGSCVPACGGGGSGGGNVLVFYNNGTLPSINVNGGGGGAATNGPYQATSGYAGQSGTSYTLSGWTP